MRSGTVKTLFDMSCPENVYLSGRVSKKTTEVAYFGKFIYTF